MLREWEKGLGGWVTCGGLTHPGGSRSITTSGIASCSRSESYAESPAIHLEKCSSESRDSHSQKPVSPTHRSVRPTLIII